MMQEVVVRLFELIMLSAAGVSFVAVILASIDDIKAAGQRRRMAVAARKLQRKSAQPPVTVIIYTYNDAGNVTGCLEVLKKSLYRNYDVVVVDNASRDGTQRAVRNFMRRHPKFALRFYAKKKRSSLREALLQAYRKSRKGELVLTIGAASRPSRFFLREAVARFLVEPDLSGLSVNASRGVPLTILDLAPEVSRAAGHVCMKSLSLLGRRRERIGLNGIYRNTLITGEAKAPIRYEGALRLPVTQHEPEAAVILWRQPLLALATVAGLLVMSYAMVLAALQVSSVPLFLSWSLTVILSLVAVWSDEGISTMQKLQLTFAAALIYFLLYVALLRYLLEQMVISVLILPELVRLRPVARQRRRTIY